MAKRLGQTPKTTDRSVKTSSTLRRSALDGRADTTNPISDGVAGRYAAFGYDVSFKRLKMTQVQHSIMACSHVMQPTEVKDESPDCVLNSLAAIDLFNSGRNHRCRIPLDPNRYFASMWVSFLLVDSRRVALKLLKDRRPLKQSPVFVGLE